MDNLVILSNDIYTSKAEGLHTACLFLDIVGAFDNVLPWILMSDLKNLGIPAKIRRFIYNFIHFRRLTFVAGGEPLGPFSSVKGTPQGSSLSPLLFTLYLRNIQLHIPANCKILLYADDLALYCSGSDVSSTNSSLQSALNNIHGFLSARGLTLSPAKSRLMLFGKNAAKISKSFNLSIDNTRIPDAGSCRFLGVILDQKMNGSAHFNYLHKKGSSIINILKSLAGVWWGAHPQTLLTVYRAVLRSAIEYGCHIFRWRHSIGICLKLERLHYKAIRIALGCRQSTPINVMQAEAKEPPLSLGICYATSKYLYKCLAFTNNPANDSLSRLFREANSPRKRAFLITHAPVFKIYVSIVDSCEDLARLPSLPAFQSDLRSYMFRSDFIESISNFNKSDNNNAIVDAFWNDTEDMRRDASTFYTDGSRVEGAPHTGAALYSPELDITRKFRLPEGTSIYSSEALAILSAVKIIHEEELHKSVIFSDSKSVLQKLSSPYLDKCDHIIMSIKNLLVKSSMNGQEIFLSWAPAHRGIPGNETADLAAKEAILSGEPTPLLRPPSDFLSLARISLKQSTESVLAEQSLSKGSLYFSLYDWKALKLWFSDFECSRDVIVTINRLRSNHYNLNASLYRKSFIASAECDCGFAEQDINHVVYHCPLRMDKSAPLRRYLNKEFPNSSQDILPLLRHPSATLGRLLLSFMRSTKLTF